MKRFLIIAVLSCFLLTFLILPSFAETTQPYVNGLFQGEVEYFYHLEPKGTNGIYSYVLISTSEASHVYVNGTPISEVGYTSSSWVYLSVEGGVDVTIDSTLTWGSSHNFLFGRYNVSTGAGSSDTQATISCSERYSPGSVSQGLSSSISWTGEVLDFIFDNLLPIVGLSIGLGLVGFGISKIIGLLNEV